MVCKGIIFDFDGTLVNLDVDWSSVRKKLSNLANQSGVDFNASSVLGSIGTAHTSLLQDPKTRNLANRFLYQAMEIITQAELAGLDKATLVPGTREILEWLAGSKIRVAILSNNDSCCVRMALIKFGLPTSMAIIGRDIVSSPKPGTEGALLALDILGLQPSECWLVGDSSPDLEVGGALGMRTILVYSPSTGDKQNKQEGIGSEASTITGLFQLKSMLER